MEAILVIVVLFLLAKSGALASLGVSLPTSSVYSPPATVIAPSFQPINSQAIGSTINTATSALSSLTSSGGALSNLASSTVSQSIPIVGAAIGAIAGVFIAQSQQRAKQAVSENQAVAAAIPGWDAFIKAIVANYNNGSINSNGVTQLLDQAMSNYWSEVTPQIQPGRNGCSGGSNCPTSANPNSGGATATTASSTYCSGDIGAACCVGCSDLALSVANLKWTATTVDKTGGPGVAFVQLVSASKYGGVNRPSYTVTFIRPVNNASPSPFAI